MARLTLPQSRSLRFPSKNRLPRRLRPPRPPPPLLLLLQPPPLLQASAAPPSAVPPPPLVVAQQNLLRAKIRPPPPVRNPVSRNRMLTHAVLRLRCQHTRARRALRLTRPPSLLPRWKPWQKSSTRLLALGLLLNFFRAPITSPTPRRDPPPAERTKQKGIEATPHCTFYLKSGGFCRNRDSGCRFRHSVRELDRIMPRQPDKLCRWFVTPTGCHTGDDCRFSHKPHLFPCQHLAAGKCPYGDKCLFSHTLVPATQVGGGADAPAPAAVATEPSSWAEEEGDIVDPSCPTPRPSYWLVEAARMYAESVAHSAPLKSNTSSDAPEAPAVLAIEQSPSDLSRVN